MSAATTSSHTRNRFLDVDEERLVSMRPLAGLTYQPLVSLQESVGNMRQQFHEITNMASEAIKRSHDPTDNLTKDESAAIFLYTMESSSDHFNVYSELNTILRLEDRTPLKSWFRYLKLIITALLKLPSSPCTVWRAVRKDLSKKYAEVQEIPWWGFSSCTTSIGTLDGILHQPGKRSLFSIECLTGKKIKGHSQFPKEDEVLLLPGTYFKVVSQFKMSDDICIIHLREISRFDTKRQTFWAINGGKKMATYVWHSFRLFYGGWRLEFETEVCQNEGREWSECACPRAFLKIPNRTYPGTGILAVANSRIACWLLL